jgi:phosphoglycerate dehydrogenase-like enzyme
MALSKHEEREMRQHIVGSALIAAAVWFMADAGAREAPVAADPEAVALVRDLGLSEGGVAMRELKGWKPPKKIVLFPLGDIDALKRVAPGVEFVVVRSEAEMLAQAGNADAVFGGDHLVCSPKLLEVAKKARWLAVYSAGVESCLGNPKLESPAIVVTNMRAVAGPVMAEHAIALAYALARGLHVSVGRQARGEGWSGNFAGSEPQSLTGKTMLIAGLGGIGLEVAERAHGLGMKVIATRGSSREGPKFVSYVGLADELPALIPQADVVVAALPLTPATTNLFDSKMFSLMKKTAYFVNMGRGGSVVTDDLVEALNNGTIAGAGLDVTEPEPLPKEHALWRAKNIIISPHMSARSDLGQSVRAQVLREQVRRFAAGEKLLAVVDFKRGY